VLDVLKQWQHERVPLVIRKATSSDTELVISSRLDFLRDVRGTGFEASSDLTARTRSFVIAESDGGRLHTWVAEEAERFAGIVSLLLWPRPPRPEDSRVFDGYIINMFVPPDRQRQGIGKQLLERCLASAPELGIGRFVLHTTDEGRQLYESTGFRHTQKWMHLAVADFDDQPNEDRA